MNYYCYNNNNTHEFDNNQSYNQNYGDKHGRQRIKYTEYSTNYTLIITKSINFFCQIKKQTILKCYIIDIFVTLMFKVETTTYY